jgi:hypothetical protein
MPKAWSSKDERQYEHVKASEKKEGKSTDRAKEIAFDHLHLHDHGVAGIEFGHFTRHARFFDLLDDIHGVTSFVRFAARNARREKFVQRRAGFFAQRVLHYQIRPALPGARHGLLQPPLRDVRVVAGR